MEEDLESRIDAYRRASGRQTYRLLGDGADGIVFAARINAKTPGLAVKFHYHRPAFERETAVYRRLEEHGVYRIGLCAVPALLGVHQGAMAIEMTRVTKPWVLDFAGAYLIDDPRFAPPAFDEEIWAYWRKEKRESFGSDWPTVLGILDYLRNLGIELHDISPDNIALRA